MSHNPPPGKPSHGDATHCSFKPEPPSEWKDDLEAMEEDEWTDEFLPHTVETIRASWMMGFEEGDGFLQSKSWLVALANEYVLKMSRFRQLEPVDIEGETVAGYNLAFTFTDEDGYTEEAHARMAVHEEGKTSLFIACDPYVDLPRHRELIACLCGAMYAELLRAADEATGGVVPEEYAA